MSCTCFLSCASSAHGILLRTFSSYRYSYHLRFVPVSHVRIVTGTILRQDDQAARMGAGTVIMGCKDDEGKVKVKEAVEVIHAVLVFFFFFAVFSQYIFRRMYSSRQGRPPGLRSSFPSICVIRLFRLVLSPAHCGLLEAVGGTFRDVAMGRNPRYVLSRGGVAFPSVSHPLSIFFSSFIFS